MIVSTVDPTRRAPTRVPFERFTSPSITRRKFSPSVDGGPRRVSFDQFTSPSITRRKFSPSEVPTKEETRAYVAERIWRKDIALCGKSHSSSSAAGVSGFWLCGNKFVCPRCSRKELELQRFDMSQALRGAEQVIFLTLTLEHPAGQRLALSLEALTATWKEAFSKGSWFSTFKKMNSITGYVRVLEVTFPPHGCHPHFHVALTLDRQLSSEDLSQVTDALLRRWQTKAEAQGRTAAPWAQEGRAVPFGQHRDRIAWYLTEQDAVRPSRPGKQRSPGDLLLQAQQGDLEAEILLRQFQTATKGQQKIATSRGFYDKTPTRRPAFPAASAITAQ